MPAKKKARFSPGLSLWGGTLLVQCWPLDIEPLDIDPFDMEPLDMEPLDILSFFFLSLSVILSLSVMLSLDDMLPLDMEPFDIEPLDDMPLDMEPLLCPWAKAAPASEAVIRKAREAVLMVVCMGFLQGGGPLRQGRGISRR
jgi:hypothetical protein